MTGSYVNDMGEVGGEWKRVITGGSPFDLGMVKETV
ncbi:MAG: hypothetical protein XD94_0236, partial [Mesotoga prima]